MRSTRATWLLVPLLLSGCYTVQPIPAELRSRPGVELRTIADAEITTCPDAVGATARQFWFGQSSKDVVYCLFKPQISEKVPMYKLQAAVPRGTQYVVRKYASWNGVDANGAWLTIEIESIFGKKPVRVSDLSSKELLGVDLE